MRQGLLGDGVGTFFGIVGDVSCMNDEVGNKGKPINLCDESLRAITGILAADVERTIRSEMGITDVNDFEQISAGFRIRPLRPLAGARVTIHKA